MIKRVKLDGDSLHQWDKGRTLVVSGFDEGTLVDFVLEHSSEVVPSTVRGDAVSIPNQVLTNSGVLVAYFYVDRGATGYTTFKYNVHITPRIKPADYVYEPTEVLTWASLDARLKVLETLGLPKFDASYEQKILYVVGGVVTPLELGPGLEIRNGALTLRFAAGGEGVTVDQDEDGLLRVRLDGVEIPMQVDGDGYAYWPGLTASVGADGYITLERS